MQHTKSRKYWSLVVFVIICIFSSIFISKENQLFLYSPNVQFTLFLFGLLLAVGSVLFYAFRYKTTKTEVALYVAFIGVVCMLVFRLGAPERSHLIEYSSLAICMHYAIAKTWQPHGTFRLAIISILSTTFVGVLDESIQMFVPHRVFDVEDMVFNVTIATSTIVAWYILQGIRKKLNQNKKV